MDYLQKLKNLGIIFYKIENNEIFILLYSSKENQENEWNYFFG